MPSGCRAACVCPGEGCVCSSIPCLKCSVLQDRLRIHLSQRYLHLMQEILCRAVRTATQDLIRSGLLPTPVQGYPTPAIKGQPSKKRCRNVGPEVAYTTAAAFPIAACARRAGGKLCYMHHAWASKAEIAVSGLTASPCVWSAKPIWH